MTYQLDITANRFDFIDFSEASAFINLMPILETTVELNFWGVTLLTSKQRRKPLNLQGINLEQPNSNIYVAGWSKVTFLEVVGGEVRVELYDPDCPDTFLKKNNGKHVILQNRWHFKPDDSIFIYELDCTADWPAGACYLALASKGPAQFTFEVSDCISARQFVLNPQKSSKLDWKEAHRKVSARNVALCETG